MAKERQQIIDTLTGIDLIVAREISLAAFSTDRGNIHKSLFNFTMMSLLWLRCTRLKMRFVVPTLTDGLKLEDYG